VEDRQKFQRILKLEKIILANRVPVDEEEMTEYIIDGISNVQLRNQVRLQQFEIKTELLVVFENINVTEVKDRSEREAKTWNKDHKGIRVQGRRRYHRRRKQQRIPAECRRD